MNPTEVTELIGRYNDAWNTQDLDTIHALHHPEIVFDNHTAAERAEGADAVREHIAAIIAARSVTPHAANNLLKTLHTLFEHAIAINMITSNPATDVRKFRIQTDGFRAWTIPLIKSAMSLA